uniref:Ubiquitin carboxyl-terminal hydrolase 7 ICP0-binding domain-containing protein n=2 Tax=Cannabis sativa TaxID=3483 RepID=A0A803NHU5_CANSA
MYFDLVNHDKVRNFRIPNLITFYKFKEKVAIEFDVPVKFQRFWVWEKRDNDTYRPLRPLTSVEEQRRVGELTDYLDKKRKREEVLRLFLEVELDLDLQPVAPPLKSKEDVLLFFKLYDPWKEELCYVGRLFVKLHEKPSRILKKLNKMAGFNPNEKIILFEETKSESCTMCVPISKKLTFLCSKLRDGDIICFQKSEKIEQCHCPDVPSFFEYLNSKGDFVDGRPRLQTIIRDVHVTWLPQSRINITQEQATHVEVICPQEPNLVEAEMNSSLSSFDALFADIQSLLEVKAGEAINSSCLQNSVPSTDDEITNARKIVKQCLDMRLASFIESGRTREFKHAVSVMLAVNSFPDSEVDEVTKFLDDLNKTCERYMGAEQDIREAEQNVRSVIELKTSLKQLSFKFIPTRNRAEEVNREIADMERQLAERKVEKAQLQSNLEDLAGKATASRQALINAELDKEPLWLKKVEAEKTVDNTEKSWESLKEHCYPFLQ